MRERIKEFHINGILVLVLFGIFAVSILLVLLTGADAYRRLTDRGQRSYTERTIPQYISTKVRQTDAGGMVSVGEIAGISALELKEEIDGVAYVTRIYCYDGYLRELFSEESMEFTPEDGEKIMPAKSIRFTLQAAQLTTTAVIADNTLTMQLALRSKEVTYEK